MKDLKFTKDNTAKIRSGHKTATSRTFKLENGWYKIDDDCSIEIKGFYYKMCTIYLNMKIRPKQKVTRVGRICI